MGASDRHVLLPDPVGARINEPGGLGFACGNLKMKMFTVKLRRAGKNRLTMDNAKMS